MSGTGRAETVDFINAELLGGLNRIDPPAWMKEGREQISDTFTSKVACFPFYSVMLALGNPTIDYFR